MVPSQPLQVLDHGCQLLHLGSGGSLLPLQSEDQLFGLALHLQVTYAYPLQVMSTALPCTSKFCESVLWLVRLMPTKFHHPWLLPDQSMFR